MEVCDLPSAPVWVTAEGNIPGCSAAKFSKKSTAKSAAFGCGVPGFFFTQSVTKSACALDQASTYWPCVGSALTQAVATALCKSAHWVTMCGLPWNLSC